MEDGDKVAELAARSACDQIAAQGAPKSVVADELTSSHRPTPVGAWDSLPHLADWIADEDSSIPFVLAQVDHEGGDVRSYRTHGLRPDEDASVGGGAAALGPILGGQPRLSSIRPTHPTPVRRTSMKGSADDR